jgi:ABC-type transport system involved in multi-copper enzyme maturation permease subunit
MEPTERIPGSLPPHQRVLRLVLAEGTRLRGRWGPVLALGTPALVVSAAALGYRFLGTREDTEALFNGWGCAAQSAGAGLVAGAFILLLLCSQLVAQEASSGALRTTLSIPVKRGEVFAAKALWACLWTAAVFVATWAVALFFGGVLFGFGDVTESVKYGGETAILTHHTAGRMGAILARVIPLSFPPLGAAAFLGLACSILAVRPAPALVSSLAVYLPLEIFLKPFAERISPYLFVTYTGRFPAALNEFARGFSTAQLASGEIRLCLISSSIASILFLVGSFIYFVRRDVIE